MVERLHVNPTRIRGGGNLLSNQYGSDFLKIGCRLNRTENVVVLDETRNVFSMSNAANTNLAIESNNSDCDYQMATLQDGTIWYPYYENEYFYVYCSLTDEDENPITGKQVWMIGSSAVQEYRMTDSNGECTFYYGMGNTEYTIQAQFYADIDQSTPYVDAISNIVKVQTGGCSINVLAKQGNTNISKVGYKEAFSLQASVLNTLSNSNMPAGVIVSFYNGDTLLGTATTNSDGVATLNNVQITSNNGIKASVGEEESNIVSLNVKSPSVTLTAGTLIANVRQRVPIEITVTDGNGHGIVGETVYFCNGNASCIYGRLGETSTDGKISTSIYKTTEGIYPVYAGIDRDGLDIRSKTVNIEYKLIVPTEISGSSYPTIIKSNETAALSALLTSTVGYEAPVPVSGLTVGFYEKYTPYLNGKLNKSLIQSGETATVSLQLEDAEDGSLVREEGVTIGLYEKYSSFSSLDASVSNPIIKSDETTTVSVQLKDAEDGSFIHESGFTIGLYEQYTSSLGMSVSNPIIKSDETATVSVQLKDATDGSLIKQEGTSISLYVDDGYVYVNDGTSTEGLIIPSNASVTVEDGALKVTTATTGEKKIAYPLNLTANDEFLFECEVAKLGTSQSVAMYVIDSTTANGCWFAYENSSNKWNGGCKGSTFNNVDTGTLKIGDKIRIKVENGVLTLYHNNAEIYSKTVSMPATYTIGHYTNKDRVQYIKNIQLKLLGE